MKKKLSLMLALVLVVSLFAGCGKTEAPKTDDKKQETTAENKTDAKEDAKTESGKEDSKQEEAASSLVSDTPKTFSIFLNFNNMPFNSDWMIWKEIAKETNVSLEGVISQSNANEEEAFSMMLASGKLADIIGYKNPADLEKLGRDGGLIPLNDLIKEHAPDLQKVLDNDAKFRSFATSLDGNIYFIPKNLTLKSAEFWWIRQDWLDKLNLQAPTTIDELYEVLTAFRNNDPNGNGQKDEIPLFDRAAALHMQDEYLYLFDTSTEFYPHDGKITFEPLNKDDFVLGVKTLAKWYQEGLIDPEIFTRGAKSRDTLYAADQAGFTHDWPSTGDYNVKLADSVPGFNNVAIAPIKNQRGEMIERTTRYPVAGWGISSQCKDPVTLIKFFNFFFTEKGSDMINFGVEGVTYTKEADGRKVFTPLVMENEELTPLNYLRAQGIQYRIGMIQNPEYEIAFSTEAAKEAAQYYESHPEWFPQDLPPYNNGALNLKYTPEEETEYQNIMANIKPYVSQMFQEWILGTKDIEESYDDFVKELKNRKIDRAIEINQAAYETFLKR